MVERQHQLHEVSDFAERKILRQANKTYKGNDLID